MQPSRNLHFGEGLQTGYNVTDRNSTVLTLLSPAPSAGDDAKIRVWQVPKGGLTEILTEPELILQGKTGSSYEAASFKN